MSDGTDVTVMDEAEMPTQNNLLDVVSAAINNPQMSGQIEVIERLLAMQREEEDRMARKAFNQSMRSAKEAMGPIQKNKWNDQTKSGYSNLSAVSAAMDPVITRHGLTVSFGTDESQLAGHYGVTCEVMHDDGFSKVYRADIPIDNAGIKGSPNKTATHAFGSSMSYGRRYLKMMIFDVATTDDNDGQTQALPVETISESQENELHALLTDNDCDVAKFCAFANIGKLGDIQANNFEQAKQQILAVIAKKERQS